MPPEIAGNFDRCDADGDGKLGPPELRAALEIQNAAHAGALKRQIPPPPPAAVRAAMRRADLNSDGQLDLFEYSIDEIVYMPPRGNEGS
eukprot:SAG22_NODE_14553_length_371_cov_1.503676_1_plen_89_part_00